MNIRCEQHKITFKKKKELICFEGLCGPGLRTWRGLASSTRRVPRVPCPKTNDLKQGKCVCDIRIESHLKLVNAASERRKEATNQPNLKVKRDEL